MVRLADLPRAQRWVQQFAHADQQTAVALLDSLTLVSRNEFLRAVLKLIEGIRDEVSGKIAFYAVREMAKDETYFSDRRAKPQIAYPGNTIGSEGVIAQLIQKFCAGDRGRTLDHPSIGTLKRFRVQNIVLVDDACLSGNRIHEFVLEFKKVATFRSWASLGRLSFYIVAYSTSKAAETTVCATLGSWTRMTREQRIHYRAERSLPTARTTCNDSTLQAIRDLCRRYPKRIPGAAFYRYGYAETMGTLVFEHGCPNNAPALLWYQAPGWMPLFPNRSIPADLAAAFDNAINPVERRERFRRVLGVENQEIRSWGKDHEEILLVLGALRRIALSERDVVHATGLRWTSVKQILNQCLKLGMIDRDRRLTPQGRNELRMLRRARPKEPLEIVEQPMYVPTSLRRSRDVV